MSIVRTTYWDHIQRVVPSVLYPNEPVGMTEVFQWDGTTDSLSGWYMSDTFQARTSVIEDATNPLGTGYSIKFDFLAGERGAGIASLGDFSPNTVSDLYIMYRVFYDPNWEFLGHKNFYWAIDKASRGGTSSNQYYVTFEASKTAMGTVQWGGTYSLFSQPNVWEVGRWMELELLAIGESAPGAEDGEFYYWMNGIQIAYRDNVRWSQEIDPSCLFGGFQWYVNRNDYNTYDTWMKVGELYLSGK